MAAPEVGGQVGLNSEGERHERRVLGFINSAGRPARGMSIRFLRCGTGHPSSTLPFRGKLATGSSRSLVGRPIILRRPVSLPLGFLLGDLMLRLCRALWPPGVAVVPSTPPSRTHLQCLVPGHVPIYLRRNTLTREMRCYASRRDPS